MKKLQEKLIYAFAALLIIGVFLPLTKLAIVGQVSYHDIASIEAYIVIALALSAPVLVFLKQPRFMFGSVAGVWITLFFPWIKQLIGSTDDSFMGQLSNKAAGVMNDFAADLFMNVSKYEWGGYLFLIGLIGFSVVTILRALAKR